MVRLSADARFSKKSAGTWPSRALAGKSSPMGERERENMVALTINGQSHSIDVDPTTPLLWVIREQVGLTGTKYGCGIAAWAAWWPRGDGVATRSGSLPVSDAAGKKITTI